MKVLLLIFIFYIHNVRSDEEKIGVKNFPKKVPGQILINYGKYANKPIPTKQLVTKSAGKDAKYTVFQRINESKNAQNIPESPYFPADPVVVQKTRVKKVLPDYVWSSLVRSKRAAETPNPKTENITSNQSTDSNQSTVSNQSIVSNQSTVSKSLPEVKEVAVQNNETRRTNIAKVQQPIAAKAKTVAAKAKKVAAKAKTIRKVVLNQKKKSQSRPVVGKGSNVAKKNPAKKTQVRGENKGKMAQKQAKGKQIASKHTNTSKLRGLVRSKTRPKGKVVGRKVKAVKKLKRGVNKQVKSKSKIRQKPKKPLRINKLKKRTAKKTEMRKGKVVKKKMSAETRRLTAAREASIEDYPYVVSIQKDDEHWCSGALLNPRLVITTANCVWKSRQISRMEIRAGSSFTDRGGQVAGIQEVMKHPGWGLRKNPDNDVALILLDRNIKFSHTCHAVDLPNRAMFPAFDDAWVASWGSERRDGIFEVVENNLQVYHSMVISRELCNNITTRFGVIVTDNFICLSQSGRTSPCTRDTGAPAVSDGILWGIASWGLRKLCGTERYPSMFSYIASQSNMDFIMNATSYLMSDQRLSPFPDRPLKVRLNAKSYNIADEVDKQLSVKKS